MNRKTARLVRDAGRAALSGASLRECVVTLESGNTVEVTTRPEGTLRAAVFAPDGRIVDVFEVGIRSDYPAGAPRHLGAFVANG